MKHEYIQLAKYCSWNNYNEASKNILRYLYLNFIPTQQIAAVTRIGVSLLWVDSFKVHWEYGEYLCNFQSGLISLAVIFEVLYLNKEVN